MAAQSKKKKAAQTQWSSDQLLVRYIIGLTLIALGVLIFLSVAVSISGAVFAGMRQICYGLAGGLAFLLPVAPIWGGVLVIISTRVKPSLRAWGFSMVLYLLLLTLMNLLSTTGAPAVSLMTFIRQVNMQKSYISAPDAYEAFLAQAYNTGVNSHMGGGLLGMLLSWPLWKALDVVGGSIVTIVGILVCGTLLFRLDVRKLAAKLRSHKEQARQADQAQQEMLNQREMNYMLQQEAARKQEAARRQQQAAMNRTAQEQPQQPWQGYQQQPYTSYQQPGQGYYPPQGQQQSGYAQDYVPSQYGRNAQGYEKPPAENDAPQTKGFMPSTPYQDEYTPVESSGIYEEYADQQQLMQQRSASNQRPKKSKIFGRKNEKAKNKAANAPAEPTEEPLWPPVAQEDSAVWNMPAEPYAAPAAAPYEPPMAQVQYPPQTAAQAPAYVPAQETYPQPAPQEMPPWEAPTPAVREAPQPKPHVEEETPITRRLRAMQQSEPVEVVSASAPQPVRELQQPQPSWTEETPEVGQAVQPSVRQQEQRLQARYQADGAAATSATMRVPVLQPNRSQPTEAWEPELKLPSRRNEPEEHMEEEPAPVPYVYPSMALLKAPQPPNPAGAEEDSFRAQRLEDTLKSFKIPAHVKHITHGPAISRFELEMAAGIKVNKVTELDRNIAMNMEVKSVRIEAPIPGKSLVGVEVPNKKVTPVTLREVLETREMKELSSPLGVALGKDIAGLPIVCDLARMPHLLIAGATGSGKSVCVNAMINSILFRSTPEQVRMILVDPKVVELQCYNGIPHLLIPVVSDPHKAAGALSWAVTEMMERYQKFTDRGVREITGYNASLEEGETPMPRILIVIDELADLMMSCKKEVEEYICRLAQLARAAGIHLVVATQRPSVDVITGLIKANIPSRIAFKVSSNVDSRTILDRNGAEKLLGYGDMLYLPNGEFTPIRVQGCFLTDSEVNRVTDFIRQHSQADYDPDVLETLEQSAAEQDGGADVVDAGNTTDGVDPLLPDAIEMAIMDGQTSISMLQRRMRIGYARAGRLIDEMTRRGIISTAAGAKPRQVLITREQFEQMSFDE